MTQVQGPCFQIPCPSTVHDTKATSACHGPKDGRDVVFNQRMVMPSSEMEMENERIGVF